MPAAPAAIRVARVTPRMVDAIRALRVDDAQLPYVGDTAFNLAQSQADPRSDAMAILLGDAVVGFYRLDHLPHAPVPQGTLRIDAALRAFVIDVAHQGAGLGTRAVAACRDDLRRRRPGYHVLGLNVHCSNTAAIRAYRSGGFVDTGSLVPGGRAGRQHFFILRLQ